MEYIHKTMIHWCFVLFLSNENNADIGTQLIPIRTAEVSAIRASELATQLTCFTYHAMLYTTLYKHEYGISANIHICLLNTHIIDIYSVYTYTYTWKRCQCVYTCKLKAMHLTTRNM